MSSKKKTIMEEANILYLAVAAEYILKKFDIEYVEKKAQADASNSDVNTLDPIFNNRMHRFCRKVYVNKFPEHFNPLFTQILCENWNVSQKAFSDRMYDHFELLWANTPARNNSPEEETAVTNL